MGAYGNAVRIPALGEYDLNPGAFKVAQMVYVAGDTLGVPAATSDTDADFFGDTVETELEIFDIEAAADDYIWVRSLLPVVVTAFTASADFSIGDTADVDGWGTEAAIGATTTDAGMTGITSDDYDNDNFSYSNGLGKYYSDSDGTIELVIDTADPAAGRLAVFAQYARVHRGGA